MKYGKSAVAVAVLLAAALTGRSGDEKRVGEPKKEITARRVADDGIEFLFVFPEREGDLEFSGVVLVDWKKGGPPPADAIYIPLRATLKEGKGGKKAYVGSFRVTKQMLDHLALETQYFGGKKGPSGTIVRLADIPIQGGGDEPKTLQGKWSGKGNGSRITLDFDKANFVLTFKELPTAFAKGTFKGTFKLNTSVKPHQLDLTVTEAPDDKYKGKTALAILRFENYGLLLCASEPGHDTRPKEFAEKGGHLNAEFGREK